MKESKLNQFTLEKRIEQTLEFIASFNTPTNRKSFLESVTEYLSELFDFKFVVIDKYSIENPSAIETMVIYGSGCIMPNIEYHLKDTPCDNVIDKELCVYPNDVQKHFPKDELLVEMGVECYVGIPLWGSNGDPIGLIAMMDDKALKDSKAIGVVLKIVAIKVSQELENQLLENELKLKIQDLSASEDKYRSIVENSPNWICELDDTGNFTYSNYQFEELLGTKLSSLNVFDLIPSPEKEILLKNFLLCVKNKVGWKDLEIRWVDRGGDTYYFESSAIPLLDQNGELTGFRGINRDTTELKKISSENLKLSTAVEQNPLAIFITNIDRELEYVNLKFTEITGFTREECIGKLPRHFRPFQESPEYYDNQWKIIAENDFWVGEIDICNSKGELIWTRLTVSPIKKSKNEIKHYLWLCEDITEEKNSKKKLEIAYDKLENSDRLKTEFLHNMSHEIRTPMNGILGFSKMLDDYSLTDKERINYVNIIQSSGEQLLQIIDDILEISKLETKQVQLVEQKVSLNNVFQELFSIFNIKAKEQGLLLRVNKGLSDEASIVYTDKTKLNKILGNLLENAFKFTSKGSISFGYVLKEVDDISEVEIFVRDTGIGIKSEMQEAIFERFSQAEKRISRKAGGLGLGLSIAKENTEILGGKIKVNSKLKEGATFFVTFPYKPVNSDVNIFEEKYEESVEGIRNTILVAEDEEVNFMFLEILLLNKLKLNCNIIHALNGEEAVQICKNNPEVSFVLMDIKMPKLNGFEATKLIREFCPDLPIIAQTAYSSREDNKLALQAGFDDFISKPIKVDALKKLIVKYLKKTVVPN